MYFHILFYPQVFPQMFLNTCTKQTFYVTPVGPMHCSWDPQTSFFSNFFIKNGSHNTIHTFRNYFAIMFSVFSFQQNKQYLNIPLFKLTISQSMHSSHPFIDPQKCPFGPFNSFTQKRIKKLVISLELA